VTSGGPEKIVLGTRGSELARSQARMVGEALQGIHPECAIETKIIRTSGDEPPAGVQPAIDPRAGRKGMFTREIERALLAGEIDAAVHSAKDLPSEMTGGLELCAVLPRAEVEDLLITKGGSAELLTLAKGAVIATGSVRRRHQLLAENPLIEVVDLRGNVPTRLRKLAESDWRGIVLARAGIERLGLRIVDGALSFEAQQFQPRVLPPDRFVPAGGQGIIAIQARSDDALTQQRFAGINDEPTLRCLCAEREFLRLLQADCNSPVGVFARIDSGVMKINAQVFDPAGGVPRVAHVEAPVEISPEVIAGRLMEKLNAG
jgi:hydroxymethylbilane synthase